MQLPQISVLDMVIRCRFHNTNRIMHSTMRILIAKKYSFAQGMLKPERKSPSMPTVDIVSPLKIVYALYVQKAFSILRCMQQAIVPALSF